MHSKVNHNILLHKFAPLQKKGMLSEQTERERAKKKERKKKKSYFKSFTLTWLNKLCVKLQYDVHAIALVPNSAPLIYYCASCSSTSFAEQPWGTSTKKKRRKSQLITICFCSPFCSSFHLFLSMAMVNLKK